MLGLVLAIAEGCVPRKGLYSTCNKVLPTFFKICITMDEGKIIIYRVCLFCSQMVRLLLQGLIYLVIFLNDSEVAHRCKIYDKLEMI